jgi:hypothetical protein
MTKHRKGIIGMALIAAMAGSLIACLDPVGFTPQLKIALDANVSGQIDTRVLNDAVLWVINRTTSVDVYKVVVDRESRPDPEKTGYTYPKSIDNAPLHASSLAIYNQPSDDFYNITISYRTATPPNPKSPGPEQNTVSIRKQLPRAADYAIFIYRDKDGNIIIKDEEPGFKPDATDDDDTEPPILVDNNVPLIIRNVTASARIDYVNISKDGFTAQSGGVKPRNDELIYLAGGTQYKARAYYKTIGSSVQNQTSEITAPVIRDATSQAWHTLYLYFYKTITGGYEITTQWPPKDQHPNDNLVNPDNDSVLFIIANKTSNATVMGIGIDLYGDADDPMAIKTFNDFVDSGPIGPDVIKQVKFLTPQDFTLQNGQSYNVTIAVDDYRYGVGKGNVLVKRLLNLYKGGAYYIEITDKTVADAPPEQPQPAGITYTVTANGGYPFANTNPAYTTTELTLVFSESVAGKVDNIGDIIKVSGATTLDSMTSPSATERRIAVTTTASEVLSIRIDKAGVDSNARMVNVYKQSTPQPVQPTVGKIILYGAPDELPVYVLYKDPANISVKKSGISLFSGVLLPPGYANFTSWALAGAPSAVALQTAATHAVLDIIGSGAELVKVANDRVTVVQVYGTHYDGNGVLELKNIAIRATSGAASSPSCKLKATIPAARNNGVEVSRELPFVWQ